MSINAFYILNQMVFISLVNRFQKLIQLLIVNILLASICFDVAVYYYTLL